MRLLDRLLNLSRYQDPADRSRAQMIYWLVAVAFPVVTLRNFVIPNTSNQLLIDIARTDTIVATSIVAFYLVTLFTLWANRSGRVEMAAWGPVMMFLAGLYPQVVLTGIIEASNGMILLLGLITLLLLKGKQALISGMVVTIMILGLAIWWRGHVTEDHLAPYITSMADVQTNNFGDLFSMASQIVGVTVMLYLYTRVAGVGQQQAISSAVQDRNLTAEIVTRIARRVSSREPIQNVFDEIIEQINDSFDTVYHTQVFLIDERGHMAQLVASTGEVGRLMLQRRHALTVGSQSVIGMVTGSGESMVARAGLTGTVHRRNELLPETMAEAAFPMRVGDKVIGALDIQSKRVDAFDDPNFMQMFQALADSVALAVDNVSQYENAEARLKENQRLIGQMQTTLSEVERLNERLTGQVWTNYLNQSQDDLGLTVDFGDDIRRLPVEWTPSLREAIQTNQLVQYQYDDQQMLTIPLRVRGQVVGAMEFELDGGSFAPEDLEMIQEVSDHFGMAVENARLVDESLRTAWRETLLNQISSRLQAADQVDELLSTAAEGLRSALEARRVSIRLGTPTVTANGGD